MAYPYPAIGSEASCPSSKAAQPSLKVGRAGSEPIAHPYKQGKSMFFCLKPKEQLCFRKTTL